MQRLLIIITCLFGTGCATTRNNSVPKYVIHNGEHLELYRTRPDTVIMYEWYKMDSVVAALEAVQKHTTNNPAVERISKKIKSFETNGYLRAESLMSKMQPFLTNHAELFYYDQENDAGYLVLDKSGHIVTMITLGGELVEPSNTSAAF